MSGNSIIYPLEFTEEAIKKVLDLGAKKYSPNGWIDGIKFDPKSNAKSMIGHYLAMLGGEEIDPDSGLPHYYNFITRAAMELHCRKYGLAGFPKMKYKD